MQLFCQYMAIVFNFSLTSSHLHPLQVENCDSNSRLVVDEDDNGKFRLEGVNPQVAIGEYKRYDHAHIVWTFFNAFVLTEILIIQVKLKRHALIL